MTQPIDETVWEQAAEGLDEKVVRALRAEGVDPQHLARAARFLEPELMPDDTVTDVRRQASYLREDLPSFFVTPAGSTASAVAGDGKSAVQRGRELAVELGWAKGDMGGGQSGRASTRT